MKNFLFVGLLLSCSLGSGGCTPKLSHRLYNYTGAAITVYTGNKVVTVGNRTSHTLGFVPQPGDTKMEGFLIGMGKKKLFYPLYDLSGQHHVDRTPGDYFEHVGFNTVQVNFGVDAKASLFVLKPASKSLEANASQPDGFPLRPQETTSDVPLSAN